MKMQNNYIPKIFKDKLSIFFNYLLSFFFIIVAIFIFLSLLTFDINDSSFLTSSSEQTKNILGTSFHPELTDDLRIHRHFADMSIK